MNTNSAPSFFELVSYINISERFKSPENMQKVINEYFLSVDTSEPERIHGAMVKKPYSREELLNYLGISIDTVYLHINGKTEYGPVLKEAFKVIHESKLNWINEIHDLKKQNNGSTKRQ